MRAFNSVFARTTGCRDTTPTYWTKVLLRRLDCHSGLRDYDRKASTRKGSKAHHSLYSPQSRYIAFPLRAAYLSYENHSFCHTQILNSVRDDASAFARRTTPSAALALPCSSPFPVEPSVSQELVTNAMFRHYETATEIRQFTLQDRFRSEPNNKSLHRVNKPA